MGTPIADAILNLWAKLDKDDDAAMTDCNKFVKLFASNFGVSIGPKATVDKIVDALGSALFTKATMGPAEAMSWVKDGLVAVGMKLSKLKAYGECQNGHVAIVHNVPVADHPLFPMAPWGTLGARGRRNSSIRRSFNFRACDDHAVHFGFAPTAS